MEVETHFFNANGGAVKDLIYSIIFCSVLRQLSLESQTAFNSGFAETTSLHATLHGSFYIPTIICAFGLDLCLSSTSLTKKSRQRVGSSMIPLTFTIILLLKDLQALLLWRQTTRVSLEENVVKSDVVAINV